MTCSGSGMSFARNFSITNCTIDNGIIRTVSIAICSNFVLYNSITRCTNMRSFYSEDSSSGFNLNDFTSFIITGFNSSGDIIVTISCIINININGVSKRITSFDNVYEFDNGITIFIRRPNPIKLIISTVIIVLFIFIVLRKAVDTKNSKTVLNSKFSNLSNFRGIVSTRNSKRSISSLNADNRSSSRNREIFKI